MSNEVIVTTVRSEGGLDTYCSGEKPTDRWHKVWYRIFLTERYQMGIMTRDTTRRMISTNVVWEENNENRK